MVIRDPRFHATGSSVQRDVNIPQLSFPWSREQALEFSSRNVGRNVIEILRRIGRVHLCPKM